MKNKLFLGSLAVIISAILWGFDGVVLTPQLAGIPLFLIVFLIHIIPFVLMQTFLFQEIKKIKKIPRNDWFFFIMTALFGGVLGTFFIIKALTSVHFMPYSIVLFLQKLQPIFAILLAIFILKEKITHKFLLWASLALVASYTLSFGFHFPQASNLNAIFYSILAAISFGSATVFGKKVLKKYEFQTTTYIRFGITSLITLMCVIFWDLFPEIKEITNVQWAVLSIIGITTGSGALFLYYWGLQKIPAKTSAMCELTMPASVVFFDYFIQERILSITQTISALVLFFVLRKIIKNQFPSKKTS